MSHSNTTPCTTIKNHLGDFFLRECKKHLPCLIPCGFTLTVRRWEERNVGEEIHDRYILTDIGGVVIPRGLDESDRYILDESDRGTIDILRLSSETWQQRLEEYGYYDSKPGIIYFERKRRYRRSPRH